MSDVTVVVEDPSVTVRLDPNGVVAAYFAGLTNDRLIKTSGGAPADSLIAQGTITGALTVSKAGSTAREATFPDADLTVAGTNYAQTWTAAQTFNAPVTLSGSNALTVGGTLTVADHTLSQIAASVFALTSNDAAASYLRYRNSASATLGAIGFNAANSFRIFDAAAGTIATFATSGISFAYGLTLSGSNALTVGGNIETTGGKVKAGGEDPRNTITNGFQYGDTDADFVQPCRWGNNSGDNELYALISGTTGGSFGASTTTIENLLNGGLSNADLALSAFGTGSAVVRIQTDARVDRATFSASAATFSVPVILSGSNALTVGGAVNATGNVKTSGDLNLNDGHRFRSVGAISARLQSTDASSCALQFANSTNTLLGALTATASALTCSLPLTLSGSNALTVGGQIKSTTSGGGAGAGFLVQAAVAGYGWDDTGAAADNGVWDANAVSEQLVFRCVNDALTVANAWLTVDRTGATPDLATFGCPVTLSGALTMGANDIIFGSGNFRQSVQNDTFRLIWGTTSGTDPKIQGYGSSHASQAGKVFYDADAHTFRTANAGTTELALTSSAATFSVPVRVNNAAVAATPTPTHTITIQDSTGTTYRIPCVV